MNVQNAALKMRSFQQSTMTSSQSSLQVQATAVVQATADVQSVLRVLERMSEDVDATAWWPSRWSSDQTSATLQPVLSHAWWPDALTFSKFQSLAQSDEPFYQCPVHFPGLIPARQLHRHFEQCVSYVFFRCRVYDWQYRFDRSSYSSITSVVSYGMSFGQSGRQNSPQHFSKRGAASERKYRA